MCGITGIYSLNGQPLRQEQILAQTRVIIHRGPNQGGVYVSPRGRCGLGVRRLSIIDVAGGRQPLANQAQTVHLVYNGETYNHRALRLELEARGHYPQTGSDGEAVLHGYTAWGPEKCLRRLRGMFAFALWDEHSQQLFLARDRFGIKPLYYAEHNGCLYFASEIKAILAGSAFPRRVNRRALAAMLRLGFVPGPDTMFEGIFKLPPAHYLLARNGSYQIRPYWQLDFHPRPVSENEAAEQFLALLEESVKLRLMSEVPLGALLSGGLDSGTLVALARGHLDALKTVSIGFEHPAYDETPLARSLAQFTGTEHHPVTFTSADFDDYPSVMYHLEEPQCSATAAPIYRLYRACRQAGLTVVLTGEGADELLGGYHWHVGDALVRPLLVLPAALRRLAARLPLLPASAAARRVLARGSTGVEARYADWLEVEGAAYRDAVLSDELKHGPDVDPLPWAGKLPHPPPAPVLNRFLWLQAQTRLVDFINFEVDKMSMAHSIEARVPFLDHKLWEFCAALPPQLKLRGRTEKYLLRRATRHLLPSGTRTRQKKGLAAPYALWLQTGPLPEWAETALSDRAINQAGLFDAAAVRQLRQAHRAGQLNLAPLLMGILSTQVWYATFLK